jgi:hypothetical protein
MARKLMGFTKTAQRMLGFAKNVQRIMDASPLTRALREETAEAGSPSSDEQRSKVAVRQRPGAKRKFDRALLKRLVEQDPGAGAKELLDHYQERRPVGPMPSLKWVERHARKVRLQIQQNNS